MKTCRPQGAITTTRPNLPLEGFVRLRDFIGRGNAFPVSRSSYHSGVKSGKYPAPTHIGKLAVLPVAVARAMMDEVGSSK